jgi:hypothetical protein
MITLADMKDTLLPLEGVKSVLAETEPLAEFNLEENNVKFTVGDSWNHGIEAKDGYALVDAHVSIGGTELPITKDALLQAAGLCGIPAAYSRKTPGFLLEPHLNYWYGYQGIGNRPAKILSANGKASAVTRQTIQPFSNIRLIESVVEGIEQRYGNEEILIDSKFHHGLAGTHVRLILPSSGFTVEDTDVEEDQWFLGLNLYNSLIGKGQTSLNGYLFRWVCSNGAVDTRASSGVWTRSAAGDGTGVYDWARDVVNSILDPLEDSRESLQAMAYQSIEGDVNQILSDLFEDYKLPARDRKKIIANMVEEDDLTMYSLMQAVTSVANDSTMDPMEQLKLMSVGGDLPHTSSHRCESCRRIKAAVQ